MMWLIACSTILYGSLRMRWGEPHRLIAPMAVLLIVALTSYLIMALTEMESVKVLAYRIVDSIGYLFVFMALLIAIDYSRKLEGWDPIRLKSIKVVAVAIILLALLNPFGLYVHDYSIMGEAYGYVVPDLNWLAAAPILFALFCSLFTIILPFQAFTEARGRYHETLTLISAGGFVLLLGAFYLNFDIIDGDPMIASLSLYVVFLIIAYIASLRLNIYIYEPAVQNLNLENAYDAVFALDPEGRLVYASERAEILMSKCFEQIRGKDAVSVLPKACIDAIEGTGDSGLVKLDIHGQLRTYSTIRFPLIGARAEDLGTAYMLRDVTDVMHYHDSVRIALEKLELLNSISRHDMLNHLTVIHGYAELAMIIDDDEKRNRYLNKILDGCLIAEAVVNFNRSYKGLGLTLDWIPLRDVFDKAVEEADLGALMNIQIDVLDVEVFSDSLISRAIYNIIHNGRCHAEGASEMRASTYWEGDEFIIVIEDDGCGVPNDEKELIFRNGYGKTSGFGLFLSKEILEISKARIWEEGDNGARLVIAFPRDNVRQRQEDGLN